MDATVAPSRRWGRVVIFLLPALAFVLLLVFAVMRVDGPVEIGEAAPTFSAPLLAGEGSLSLASLDEPVVLNFWASWCGPCVDEAPMLRKAQEEYGDRIAFVGVNIKDARTDALGFVEDYELSGLTHVRDEGDEIYNDYGLTGQPETFFIDGNGKVVEHVNGPLLEDTLFSMLDVLVERDG
jgi:cytochrome c biogenesis protein CcmG/thiol:disulfide interchange protein DsbE